MRRLGFVFVFACGSFLAGMPAARADVAITARLRSVATAAAVEGTITVVCTGLEPVVLVKGAGGTHSYQGPLSVGRSGSCEVTLEGTAGTGYVSRNVVLTAAAVARRPRASFEFFLMQKPPEFNYRYLKDGDRYLSDSKPDRAIGYFEPAYAALGSENTDDYRLLATYGYANGLQRACLALEYATCSEARQLYRRLVDLFSERLWTTHCGISKERLNKESGDTLDKERNSLYGQIPGLVQQGEYLPAAHLAVLGLAEVVQDPQGFADVGLTRKRLLADGGDAFLKAALESESRGENAKAKELFGKASELLEQIRNPDSLAAGNIALARAKAKTAE